MSPAVGLGLGPGSEVAEEESDLVHCKLNTGFCEVLEVESAVGLVADVAVDGNGITSEEVAAARLSLQASDAVYFIISAALITAVCRCQRRLQISSNSLKYCT